MVRVLHKRLIPLSAWIEATVRLPSGIAAAPGPIKLHPYQRAIADAIADPKVERVSVLKSARVGFTTLLVGAIAHYIVREPSPVLVVMPTESDARGLMVDDIEGLFAESPALRDHLPMPHPGRSDRNTLVHRIYDGGSLKIVAAGAPRNMRRHSARVLLIDEVDACEVSAEGDPVALAIQRTLTWANRKIVVGGTPLEEATSHITRAYGQSDMCVFEVPCPECGGFTEIVWRHIEWQPDRPDTAAFRCPHCEALIAEKHKPAMARNGRWRPTNDVGAPGHVGFRINALVSLLPNASWGRLAAEFLAANDDSDTLRVFVNTVLGEPWREQADELDQGELMSRVEGFDLDHVPSEVLVVTAGCDVQEDRLETSIVGHGRDGTMFVLGHQTLWGSPLDDDLWHEFDQVLQQRWRHPSGGVLKVDAAAVDSGGQAGVYDIVLKFSQARLGRKVLAIKGASGFGRPIFQASKTKRGRLFIVGVDNAKAQLLTRLARGRTIRFSHTLDANYFEQLASERRVVRMSRGRPVARFERKVGARAESLDALVYALAAKAALQLGEAAFNQRADALRAPTPAKGEGPPVARSAWMARQHRSWDQGGGW